MPESSRKTPENPEKNISELHEVLVHLTKKVLRLLLKHGRLFNPDLRNYFNKNEGKEHLSGVIESLLDTGVIRLAPGTAFEPVPSSPCYMIDPANRRTLARNPDKLICFCEPCTEKRFNKFDTARRLLGP